MSYPFIVTVGKPMCEDMTVPTDHGSALAAGGRKSLLFEEDTNQYMILDQQGGSNDTWTIFFSIKRNNILKSEMPIISQQFLTNQLARISFNGIDNLVVTMPGMVSKTTYTTFKDTAAWYHFMVTRDGTNCSVFVNGESVLTQDGALFNVTNLWGDNAATTYIGRPPNNTAIMSNLSAYITMIGMHDNVAHSDMSDFGDFSSITGEWVPKDPDTSTWNQHSYYLSGQEDSTDDFCSVFEYDGMSESKNFNGVFSQDKADFVALKVTSTGGSWNVFDVDRSNGASRLAFDNTSGEVGDSSVSLINGGFGLSDSPTANAFGEEYLAWVMRKDPSKGFNIVRYVGSGTGARPIPHGGSSKPRMVWIKELGTGDWKIWIEEYTANIQHYKMDDNPVVQTGATQWDGNNFSDTVVALGSGTTNNIAGVQYVMYVFWDVPGSMEFSFPFITGDLSSGIECFSAGGDNYVLTANANGEPATMHRYNHDTKSFTLAQTFTADNGQAWKTFIVNGTDIYAVLADSGSTPDTFAQSKLYQFDTSLRIMVVRDSFNTTNACSVETYEDGGTHYVIVGNSGNTNASIHNSATYEFDGVSKTLTALQTLPTNNARHIKLLDDGLNKYIIIANGNIDPLYNRGVSVYKVANNSLLVPHQTINNNGCYYVDVFDAPSGYVAVITNSAGYSLYRFSSGTEQFTQYAAAGISNSRVSKVFNVGSEKYLVTGRYRANATTMRNECTLAAFDPGTETFFATQNFMSAGVVDIGVFYHDIDKPKIMVLSEQNDDTTKSGATFYDFDTVTKKLNLGGLTGNNVAVLSKPLENTFGWKFYYNITNAQAKSTSLSSLAASSDSLNVKQTKKHLDMINDRGNAVVMAIKDTSFISEITSSSFGGKSFTPNNLPLLENKSSDSPFNNLTTLDYLGGTGSKLPVMEEGNLTTSSLPPGNRETITFKVPEGVEIYFEMLAVQVSSFIAESDPSIHCRAGIIRASSTTNTYGLQGVAGSTKTTNLSNNDIVGIHLKEDLSWDILVNGVVVHAIGSDTPFGDYLELYVTSGSKASVNFGQKPFLFPPSLSFKTISGDAAKDELTISDPSKFFKVERFFGTYTTPYKLATDGKFDILFEKTESLSFPWRAYFSVLTNNTYVPISNTPAVTEASNMYARFDDDGIEVRGDVGTGHNQDASLAFMWKANHCSGMNVKLYNGTGLTGNKVLHGLDEEPDALLVKGLDTNTHWVVRHEFFGDNIPMPISGDVFGSLSGNFWNNIPMDDRYVTLGNSDAVNGLGDKYLLWAIKEKVGFSKVGSYTGTAQTGRQGPFIQCGFKPALVIIKGIDDNSSWLVYHNQNSVFLNPVNRMHALNAPAGLIANNDFAIDFKSNGFKVSVDSTVLNGNGYRYFYMAFAETPAAFSNAT